MSYYPRRHMTLQELRQARDRHSTYQRLHRLPQKDCRVCGKTYPNDHKHFRTGKADTLIRVCLNCPVPHPSQRTRGSCPICEEPGVWLVHDGRHPRKVRICRRCLRSISIFNNTAQQAAVNLVVYMAERHDMGTPEQTLSPAATGEPIAKTVRPSLTLQPPVLDWSSVLPAQPIEDAPEVHYPDDDD